MDLRFVLSQITQAKDHLRTAYMNARSDHALAKKIDLFHAELERLEREISPPFDL